MGEISNIQWTDATFNPWRGCHKISEGCKHCYAEAFVTKRQGLPVWGQDAARKVAAESTWREPEKWNRQAAAAGERRRVFCASLADVFEDYRGPDAEAITAARARLFALIEKTQSLDWLLLTKRPDQVLKMVPRSWLSAGGFPRNVWIGCTAENQQRAEERLPHLLGTPARVRFVSYEPALGPIDFTPWMPPWRCDSCQAVRLSGEARCSSCGGTAFHGAHPPGGRIDWLIVGGESGPGARPFDMAWARSAVKQCAEAGAPVFVKQMGARPIDSAIAAGRLLPQSALVVSFLDKKGGDIKEWPADLRVRQVPEVRH